MCDKDNMQSNLSLIPELLSKNELCSHVAFRCGTIRGLQEMNHDRLVSLYRQMVLPMAQRVYKPTWRGKLLTKKRRENGLEAANENDAMSRISANAYFTSSSSSSSSPTNKREPPRDRLKPPPEVSARSRLSSSSESSNNHQKKIIVNDRMNKGNNDTKNSIIEDSKKRSGDSILENLDASKPKREKITWP